MMFSKGNELKTLADGIEDSKEEKIFTLEAYQKGNDSCLYDSFVVTRDGVSPSNLQRFMQGKELITIDNE